MKLSDEILAHGTGHLPIQIDATQPFRSWYEQANALEQTNANLLEALEQMSQWFDADGYATSVPPRVFVAGMRQAIQQAKEK